MVSALFFVLAALRSRELMGLLGGLFFFVASVLFPVPLVTRGP